MNKFVRDMIPSQSVPFGLTRKAMNQKPRKPTVGEALVELLSDYGVELIFGIPAPSGGLRRHSGFPGYAGKHCRRWEQPPIAWN